MGNLFAYWRHSYSIEEDNFIRFGLALLTIGPMILQDVLKSYVSPKDLTSIISQESSPQFWNTFNAQEKSWLAQSTSHGFTKFDVNFCYKLLKFVRLNRDDSVLEMPVTGQISRAVERMEIERFMRLHDEIYDNIQNRSMSTRKVNNVWKILIDFCTKMQNYSDEMNFLEELSALESRTFTEEERKTVIDRLYKMKDQRMYIASLEVQEEDTLSVKHVEISSSGSRKKSGDRVYTEGIFAFQVEELNARDCGTLIIRYLALIEIHLKLLEETFDIFRNYMSFWYSDSSDEDKRILNRQYIHVIDDMKHTLFLVSVDVNSYVMEYQESDHIFVYNTYSVEEIEIERKRFYEQQHEEIKRYEYHIQKIKNFLMLLPQSVEGRTFGNERSKIYGRAKKEELRQILYQRCDSLRDVCFKFYIPKILHYGKLIHVDVEEYSDEPKCNHPKMSVWLRDDQDHVMGFPSRFTGIGKDQIFRARNTPAEYEVFLYRSHLSDLHRNSEDVRMLAYMNRRNQLYYRIEVMQKQLAALKELFRMPTKRGAFDETPIDEQKEIVYDIRVRLFNTMVWIESCMLSTKEFIIFTYFDAEVFDHLKRYWNRCMYNHENLFNEERWISRIEMIKHTVHYLEENAKILSEETDWIDSISFGTIQIPTYSSYYMDLKLDTLLRKLSEFLENLEYHGERLMWQKKDEDGFDQMKKNDNELKEDCNKLMTDITEGSETEDKTQIVHTVLENIKKEHPGIQFMVCRSCSQLDKRVIIGYDYLQPQNRATTKYINEVEVIIKNPYQVDDEATFLHNYHVTEGPLRQTENMLNIMHECIKANANNLWRNHSNLTIITGDSLKSQNGKPSLESCIVLYCLSKGFVPEQEEEFPKELTCRLGALKTDVREGFFTLGPTDQKYGMDAFNDPLCMGSNIGSSMRDTSGSLGLFVNLPNDEKGFITCCHVLFDCIGPKHFLYRKDSSYAHRVVQPGNTVMCGRNDRECGIITWAVFDPSISSISVDAALVQITRRPPNSGHFVIKDLTQTRELGECMSFLAHLTKAKVSYCHSAVCRPPLCSPSVCPSSSVVIRRPA